eukprot:TRINITY_DN62069_c0_g2_i2.p1 TRINITY_DN62069_c0_g2~~TRINITY_DN62069_c0_g2_i2.p1  ORF type:complete len:237 (-),score=27.85 TRINITY_DN62069_c0_g2_i2:76-786(-)
MVVALRIQDPLYLVDTSGAEWTFQAIKVVGMTSTPDSVIVTHDGMIAVSSYAASEAVRLFEFNVDWRTAPTLHLVAQSTDANKFGACCVCLEDPFDFILVCDIMADRVVRFERQWVWSDETDDPEALVENLVIQGFHRPCGLALLAENQMAVTEWGKTRVSICILEGQPVFSFDPGCDCPRGICLDFGHNLLVTDYNGNSLRVFDLLKLQSIKQSGHITNDAVSYTHLTLPTKRIV